MSRKIRSSKYRHVFTDGPKPDQCYNNMTPSFASGDHQGIKCNTKFFATGIKGGGCPLLVYPLSAPTGSAAGTTYPLLNAHTSDVTDIDFHPFNQNLLVSGSLDQKLNLWKIPEGGLTEPIDPISTIKGNKKKVLYTLFNPSANNILATIDGGKNLNIFDIERTTPVMAVTDVHTKLVQDLKWTYDGSCVATTSKDKAVRIFDPRAGTEACQTLKKAVDGLKTFKMEFLHNHGQFVVCGFNRTAQRCLKTFDHRTMSLITETRIDSGSGFVMPFYDEGTNLLYLSGKGDSNIRILERTGKKPFSYECSNPRVTSATKGMCMMPKRALNIMDTETTRFYKLVANGVEPISFTIPRRDEGFQEDLYPNDKAGVASLSGDAWLAGENKPPTLTSMDPEDLESAAASAAASGGGEAVFVPKAAKTVAELEEELRLAKLRIKELKGQALKLKGKIAKNSAKPSAKKEAAPTIDLSEEVVKEADAGDNWDDEDEAAPALPVTEPAAEPEPEPAAEPEPEPAAEPEPEPESDEIDPAIMAEMRKLMGDALDYMPPDKIKELAARLKK